MSHIYLCLCAVVINPCIMRFSKSHRQGHERINSRSNKVTTSTSRCFNPEPMIMGQQKEKREKMLSVNRLSAIDVGVIISRLALN